MPCSSIGFGVGEDAHHSYNTRHPPRLQDCVKPWHARMARGSELRGIDLLKKLKRVSHFRYPFVMQALLGEFSSSQWASPDVCGQVYFIKLGEGNRSRILVPFECLTHFLRTSIILISELCGKERASCHQAYRPSAHHALKCKEGPEFTARLACVLEHHPPAEACCCRSDSLRPLTSCDIQSTQWPPGGGGGFIVTPL